MGFSSGVGSGGGSGTPASTVTDERTIGVAPAVGTGTNYAREDHTHGSTNSGAPAASAVGDAQVTGVATTFALSDHKHAREAFATPNLTLGTANAGGAATTLIRSDATILAFDATSPAASAVGDAAAVGVATVAARRDHKHAREAFATPAIVLSTAAAGGAATTLIRSDATIAAFDATVPTTSASADAAATGSAAFAARRDHVHGRETVYTQAIFSISGTVATGTGKFRWYNKTGRTLTFVGTSLAVNTAPTGTSLICDINKDATTIYTTQGNRPTIAISGNNVWDSTAPDVTTIADGSYITADVDQVGSTIAGADLVVQVYMKG